MSELQSIFEPHAVQKALEILLLSDIEFHKPKRMNEAEGITIKETSR